MVTKQDPKPGSLDYYNKYFQKVKSLVKNGAFYQLFIVFCFVFYVNPATKYTACRRISTLLLVDLVTFVDITKQIMLPLPKNSFFPIMVNHFSENLCIFPFL